jgi:hypothetical protein
MDEIKSEYELIDVSKGEASLPPPPVSTKPPRRKGNPEDDDKYLVPIPPWTPREIIVACLASCSVVLGIVLVLIPFVNPLVFVTGIIGIVLPPYSALQEQKITDCKG